MGTDAAIDRVKKELLRAFDNPRAEFDRIELPGRGSCCIQYAPSES
jgi:hypothetical protein